MKAYRFPLIFLFVLFSCASPPTSTPVASIGKDELRDSTVEIKYSLAQSHYRLEVGSKNGKVEALNGLNDQPLERREIARERYVHFVNHASITARAILRESKEVDLKDCKTPYALTISRVGQDPVRVAGCRSHDPEGRIGRLIQEGEFLFYSPPVR